MPPLFFPRGQKTRGKTAALRAANVRLRGIGNSVSLISGEAHDHLQRALGERDWDVIRGWHTFRHSFITACASKGVDQRLVETWSAHMSAEMSRRYTDLCPSTQQEALGKVFG